MPHPPGETPGQEASAEGSAATARRLLDRGEPLLAYNELQAALERSPGEVRLRQLQALALARSGDVGRANSMLAALATEGHDDAETLGMLARTHKDLAFRTTEATTKVAHLASGFQLYMRAFESAKRSNAVADAYYTGINAATMAVLAGDFPQAHRIAVEVRDICGQDIENEAAALPRHWREASLGEAALILGDEASALRHYAEAARLAGTRYGDVSTTRRQARLLLRHLPPMAFALEEILRIPPVLVFTGNMIDQPGRASARFSASMEPQVRDALRKIFAALKPLAVYGSGACGADLLCLEAAREQGSETHVVLPFPPEDFRRASVDFAPGDWGARFDQAIRAAQSVTIASDHRAIGSAASFEYANLILTGMGRLRAQVLDTSLRTLAVWDPAARGAAGGSASLVSLWERRGLTVDHVHLGAFRVAGLDADVPETAELPDDRATPETRHEMRAMLFADAVGYSKLSEDQIPRYISGFLGAIADLGKRTSHPYEYVNTWGDGIYMVFGGVEDAANFALELSTLVNDMDMAACGLPRDFSLRIALHCGPVHCGRDPLTGSRLYTGPHASRAARIEPITPPGQVYASSAFAAVATASGVEGLAMGYIGRIPLAKGYGTLGLYHVHPAH